MPPYAQYVPHMPVIGPLCAHMPTHAHTCAPPSPHMCPCAPVGANAPTCTHVRLCGPGAVHGCPCARMRADGGPLGPSFTRSRSVRAYTAPLCMLVRCESHHQGWAPVRQHNEGGPLPSGLHRCRRQLPLPKATARQLCCLGRGGEAPDAFSSFGRRGVRRTTTRPSAESHGGGDSPRRGVRTMDGWSYGVHPSGGLGA